MNNLIITSIISCCTIVISFPIILKYTNYVLQNDIEYLKEECEELDKLLKNQRAKI